MPSLTIDIDCVDYKSFGVCLSECSVVSQSVSHDSASLSIVVLVVL